MSSDTEEFIRQHFNSLQEDETEFTSGQSKTHSHLPEQSIDEEAREIEEAIRILAQEAMERQKKKGKAMHKTPHETGEPFMASAIPQKHKASLDTSALSPTMERGIMITMHLPLG